MQIMQDIHTEFRFYLTSDYTILQIKFLNIFIFIFVLYIIFFVVVGFS